MALFRRKMRRSICFEGFARRMSMTGSSVASDRTDRWFRGGPKRDGWTESKAKAELRARLVDVDREGRRKLEPMRFEHTYRDDRVRP
jgi:hypothetical protein